MVKGNRMDYGYIVRWQADLVNTKESLLPVYDKPYHKIQEIIPHWKELDNLWSYAWFCYLSSDIYVVQVEEYTFVCIALSHNLYMDNST